MQLSLPKIRFDEHLARLLLLTLILAVAFTGGEILGEVFIGGRGGYPDP